MTPVRGEVWLLDLGMVEKVRPALIVSAGFGDLDRALISVVPHTTSSLRGSQFEVVVPLPFLKAGAFPVDRSPAHGGLRAVGRALTDGCLHSFKRS
jgi:mRNA interferase MazF